MDDNAEIGNVTTPGGIIATLWGVDDWTVDANGSPADSMARFLTIQFKGQYQRPEYGYYGQKLLQIVAEFLHGKATVTKKFPAPPPGEQVIY